jgi:hypothetical protein
MCLFTHIAAGALAGALSPNALVAPVLGLGSHVLLDILPHYDFENMAVEIVLGAAVVAALAVGGALSLAVCLGALFAALPDFENLLWKLGRIRDEQKVFPGHVGVIRHGPPAGKGNIVLQFVTATAVIVFLIWRAA